MVCTAFPPFWREWSHDGVTAREGLGCVRRWYPQGGLAAPQPRPEVDPPIRHRSSGTFIGLTRTTKLTMPIISLFNNKGGVGKTTFLFHVAHVLAEGGHKVLMVDCDSQCNLTAYALQDKAIEKAWEDNGNSIYRAIEPVARGIGDGSVKFFV
jgi:hypothetical protein